MKNHPLKQDSFDPLLLFICGLAFLSSIGCVSVDLGPKAGEKTKRVRLQEPVAPFEKVSIEGMDKAWQDKKSGNTLGYISECGGRELSLDQLENEARSVLVASQLTNRLTGEFNQRESLESWSEGLVDGVKVRLAILVFKKNGCQYTLTYAGPAKSFNLSATAFTNFKQGFVAP